MKDSIFGPFFSVINEGSFTFYPATNYPSLPNKKLAAISDTSVVGAFLIKLQLLATGFVNGYSAGTTTNALGTSSGTTTCKTYLLSTITLLFSLK